MVLEATGSWYYTPTGSKQRVGLFDEAGERIRGKGNKQAADLALARVQFAAGFKVTPIREPTPPKASQPWIAAKVCSEYLQYCERRVSASNMSRDYRQSAIHYLMQSHRIGDLAVAAKPFEVFAEIGLGLKVRSPIHPLTNISIANGSHGYLPNPERHISAAMKPGLVSTKYNSTPQ